MKFSAMSTSDAEEWLRKLHENVARKRQVMYRFIAESVRMIMFGNGGGIALVMGMAGSEPTESYHGWLIANMVLFILGVLCTALSLAFVTSVTVKEAHSAELGMYQFIHDEKNREQTLFFSENTIPRLSIIAGIWALLAAICLGAGGLSVLALLAFYF